VIAPKQSAPEKSAAGPAPDPTAAIARLGVIDYLNVLAVYDAILRRDPALGSLAGIRTVSGVPTAMNRALLAGEVDLSNVSSYAYGQHAAEWLLVPDLSVAAHGRVASVLLFSWHADWRALDDAPIALTPASATSVALVRLLCERRYGVHPRFVTANPDAPLDAMLASSEAALLIGDTALQEGHRRRPIAGRGRPRVFDLAAEWHAWTGLPFVFAVWAVRAGAADRARAAVALLRASRARGQADLDRIAAAAAARLDLPLGVCADYLRLLDYDLSARDRDGLRAFLELAIPDFSWASVRFFEG
jgi:chorismate dehydratase